ncbi:unnamed protein product [Adineta steineri]|uniref:Uncharacterized protein n=1 Tax=Adineta steineri TaxID=433720 RepID=A0A820FTP4_9BILA|nr:unnamed protein product [Adineta steineri]CAF4266929.1 unnamed protein product [Adineta steineri]
MYIANEAFKRKKDEQFVSNVLDYLEITKQNNPNDDIIESMITGIFAKSRAVAVFRDLKSTASHTNTTSSPNSGASMHDQSDTTKDIPFDIISQAQKLCRYANSTLKHEDIIH